jgi:hypothetical protein
MVELDWEIVEIQNCMLSGIGKLRKSKINPGRAPSTHILVVVAVTNNIKWQKKKNYGDARIGVIVVTLKKGVEVEFPLKL